MSLLMYILGVKAIDVFICSAILLGPQQDFLMLTTKEATFEFLKTDTSYSRHFELLCSLSLRPGKELHATLRGQEVIRNPCLLSTEREHRGSLASCPTPSLPWHAKLQPQFFLLFWGDSDDSSQSRVASAALGAETAETSQLETFRESPANHIHFLCAVLIWEKTANWASAKIGGSSEERFLKRMLGFSF